MAMTLNDVFDGHGVCDFERPDRRADLWLDAHAGDPTWLVTEEGEQPRLDTLRDDPDGQPRTTARGRFDDTLLVLMKVPGPTSLNTCWKEPDMSTETSEPPPTAASGLDGDRILALELVRATEAAAMAAARLLGRGVDQEVDGAAVDAMRPVLGTIPMRGLVVIAEGENDDTPMLYPGEYVGAGTGPLADVAIDPVDGAGLTARSLPNALSVVALADRGAMLDPGPCVYMDKLVVGQDLVDVIDYNAPIEDTLQAIARVRGVGVGEVTVALLDRPRHQDLIGRIRSVGARIKLLIDGEVAGALMALQPESEVDLLVGIGGTPEGIIAACATHCLGGAIYGRLAPRTSTEARQAHDAGCHLDRVLTAGDLVRGHNAYFAATAVTNGDLLRGVRFGPDSATTQSMAMRSLSGAVRVIETRHRLSTSMLVPTTQPHHRP
jgi:fructose-1,6-bisphosphatase II